MRGIQGTITFEVERDQLVRHVRRTDGRGHTQRATLRALKEVVWAVEERRENGVTSDELWHVLLTVPCTQISVALDFLKQLGCVETRGRRTYPASSWLFEDAMIEFYALAQT